jgi:hypothetical protein
MRLEAQSTDQAADHARHAPCRPTTPTTDLIGRVTIVEVEQDAEGKDS